MKKILFPTDFSDNAKKAFQYALKIAEALNAKIEVAHVYAIVFNETAALPSEYVEQLINDKKSEVNAQLKTFVSEADEKLIENVKAIYGVFTAMEISDYAKREGFDGIIMGTKGAQNAIDRIMGTVTTSVIMYARCPVIAIPKLAVYTKINSIALAVSFAHQNDYAIKQLEKFAAAIQAGIHLVHVDSKGKEKGAEAIIENANSGPPFTQFTVIHNRSVTQGLESFVKKNRIDMLALYIPNRRLWERIFHQSVSKKMVLHTNVPLIVYHE